MMSRPIWREYWAVMMDRDGDMGAVTFHDEQEAKRHEAQLRGKYPTAEIWLQHGAWEHENYVGLVPDLRSIGNIPTVG